MVLTCPPRPNVIVLCNLLCWGENKILRGSCDPGFRTNHVVNGLAAAGKGEQIRLTDVISELFTCAGMLSHRIDLPHVFLFIPVVFQPAAFIMSGLLNLNNFLIAAKLKL